MSKDPTKLPTKKPKRARSGAQAELALDVPQSGESFAHAVAVAAEASVQLVQFVDPDPTHLWAGQAALGSFLRDHGQGWVLAVRVFMRQRDWTAFEADYKPGGRPAAHPATMMSLALLGTLEGATSLRDLERLARVDLRAWWLTGGLMPDHSAIGRFLNRHASLIGKEFFEDLTRAIVKLVGEFNGTIAVDATVIQAAASRLRTIKQEAARAVAAEAKARAQAAPNDERLAKAAVLAEDVVKTAEERSAIRRAKGRENPDAPVSPTEPSAMIQPLKSGQIAPSYQSCIAVDANRIVLAHCIEPSSEPAAVPDLVERTAAVTARSVTTLLGDGRYNCFSTLTLASLLGIELLAPANRNDKSHKPGKHFDKSRFIYDINSNTYMCPADKVLAARTPGQDDEGRTYTPYRATGCSTCPLRDKCCKGQSNREVKRYDHEPLREALTEHMAKAESKAKYAKRQTSVEPVFAETKGIGGFVRFGRRTTEGRLLEQSLHYAAHNLRRALRIKLPQTRHAGPGTAGSARRGAGAHRARTQASGTAPTSGSPSRNRRTAAKWNQPQPQFQAVRPNCRHHTLQCRPHSIRGPMTCVPAAVWPVPAFGPKSGPFWP